MSQLNPVTTPSGIEIAGASCLALAVIHSFACGKFHQWAAQFQRHSFFNRLFHLFSEVEIAFFFWSVLFLLSSWLLQPGSQGVQFVMNLRFTEPVFVFCIMMVAATRPIIGFAERLLEAVAKKIPLSLPLAKFFTTLTLGPLLGSFITEPAAMTVVAFVLLDWIFHSRASIKLRYVTLALLFVHVSIGGTLTHFAAPPVLMVAEIWSWDTPKVFLALGWKSCLAILISTTLVTYFFRHELRKLPMKVKSQDLNHPAWIQIMHLIFLFAIVLNAHHSLRCAGVFLLFLSFFYLTRKKQNQLWFRSSFLVALFLASLVILGSQQRWWLEPLLNQLNSISLFIGASVMTAVTDNAALTYLGAQVPDLSEASRYALLAGAVTGGGLTVIANAPNPIGFGILRSAFPNREISAIKLVVAALGPTLIAGICLWIL